MSSDIAKGIIEKLKEENTALQQEVAALREYRANTTVRIAALEKENVMWLNRVQLLIRKAQL